MASTTNLESWSEIGKAAFEPLLEFNSITSRLYSEMTRENLKTINKLMKNQAEQWQNFSGAKDLEDVMDVQAQWSAKTSPSLYEHAQRMLDMYLEGVAEYNKWFERGIDHFSEKRMFPEKTLPQKTKKK